MPSKGRSGRRGASGSARGKSNRSSKRKKSTVFERVFESKMKLSASQTNLSASYKMGATIGEGTFGKVKKGTHTLTGLPVAIKILEKDRIVDSADVERVRREIAILRKVRHPNIIQLYEVIDSPRHLYLIMNFAPKGELFDYIVNHGRVKERKAAFFFHQIINGVDYCHRNNVIHRDLKPENLLLGEADLLQIVDFGLGNLVKPRQLLTTACGSPCYAAPEMIAGKKYYGPSADMWSLGVILYALVCGYLPFEDANTAKLYDKIMHGRYELPDFISGGVRDLITKLLRTDPRKRYTAEQVRTHPWYAALSVQTDPALFNSSPDQAPINQDVVRHLAILGFDSQTVTASVHNVAHDQHYANYHLLLQKRLPFTGEASMKQPQPEATTSSSALPVPGEAPAANISPKKHVPPPQAPINAVESKPKPAQATAEGDAVLTTVITEPRAHPPRELPVPDDQSRMVMVPRPPPPSSVTLQAAAPAAPVAKPPVPRPPPRNIVPTQITNVRRIEPSADEKQPVSSVRTRGRAARPAFAPPTSAGPAFVPRPPSRPRAIVGANAEKNVVAPTGPPPPAKTPFTPYVPYTPQRATARPSAPAPSANDDPLSPRKRAPISQQARVGYNMNLNLSGVANPPVPGQPVSQPRRKYAAASARVPVRTKARTARPPSRGAYGDAKGAYVSVNNYTAKIDVTYNGERVSYSTLGDTQRYPQTARARRYGNVNKGKEAKRNPSSGKRSSRAYKPNKNKSKSRSYKLTGSSKSRSGVSLSRPTAQSHNYVLKDLERVLAMYPAVKVGRAPNNVKPSRMDLICTYSGPLPVKFVCSVVTQTRKHNRYNIVRIKRMSGDPTSFKSVSEQLLSKLAI